MLDGRDMRIAARVQRHGYAGRYPCDLTIRSRRPSGNPTGLAKIVNGEGDWLFYGHANASGTGFDLWWLLDLRAFRAGLIRHASNGYPTEPAQIDGIRKSAARTDWPSRPSLSLLDGHRIGIARVTAGLTAPGLK
ncbi:hypothetical protein ACDP63_18970 [Paracoccus sp. P2]|uniref:hypothetical protein n=1 Tax=Paracoccus TaxID=265 RepID=UPI0004B6CD5C|nr:hypothetical protein [Paracoccus pantotrophus]MDF3855726.1 hypothetical protein [Paracoccus pantotrophus]SFO80183.1 hypothetical protein SAMN04244567_03127 [Paracoccus pantotrophus]